MPKSVKEVLLEQENYESLKGFYAVIPAIDNALIKLDESKESCKLDCSALNESVDSLKSMLLTAKDRANKLILIGRDHINEAKTFEEDDPVVHFSHGLMTCYIDPSLNRFVLTKDSRNGERNYDTIINMTKNDLKNIIKCCTDMLADIKAKAVPEEEPAKED